MVSRCQKLRAFSCIWSYECYGQQFEWLQLTTAFQSIRRTLETLELRFAPSGRKRGHIFPDYISQSTALAGLPGLRSLSLSAYMLLGHRGHRSKRTPQVRPKLAISQCLPRNLERLSIQSDAWRNRYIAIVDHVAIMDDDNALPDFAEDLHLFPALHEISISTAEGAQFTALKKRTTELVRRFAEKGVTFLPPKDA